MSSGDKRVAGLLAEQEQLRAAIGVLEKERDGYKRLYELSREEVERLKRGLVGPKAERLPTDVKQLTLGVLGLAVNQGAGTTTTAEEDASPKPSTQAVRAHERKVTKPTGRKPLPEHLPIVRITLRPEDAVRNPDDWVCIGKEVSETLEWQRASFVRVITEREKFAPKDRPRNGPTRIIIAEPPELPIQRGLAGPGMLADSIVKRWEDHTPLHRMERIYAREGLELARSTIGTWHEQLAELCQVLIDAMLEDAYRSPYLCTDATGVLVQAKERCRNGHFWVLVAPERHVLYRFSKRHDGKAVDDLLGDYTGTLVADAHVVYDHLYVDGRVAEAGCWAHTRRYFFKTLASDPERAKIALALIAKLFLIERDLAGAPRKKREKVRAEQSLPVVDRFFAWCVEQRVHALDGSPLSQGLGYALNQEGALRRFLGDGRLPIHNNDSERALRRQVVGRKNWLFVGSEDGAKTNSIFVSLLASCRMHGIEPWAYLRDLFCLLPRWPSARVLELAPVNWKETAEQADTQQLLAANVFRVATLTKVVYHEDELAQRRSSGSDVVR